MTRLERLAIRLRRELSTVKMLGIMPAVAIKLRKLSGDETASVFPRRGQMDLSEYLQALSALQPGDVGAWNSVT